MDDFAEFYSGLSRTSMQRYEYKIVGRADLIWASSPNIKSRLSSLRRDVQLVSNGLDARVLEAAIRTPMRNDKFVFGYVGTVGSWFDWDWVFALARARPCDSIHLIGPVYESPSSNLPRNVELFGEVNHQASVRLMSLFDIGLIPFKANKLTESIDPIKYYEYRGLGLPVISTNFGEMSDRAEENGVYLSNSVIDISELVTRALMNVRNPVAEQSFRDLNSWGRRFDLSGLLEILGSSELKLRHEGY
jgi:glycosyltransferase involved in cell wall biosynthesis